MGILPQDVLINQILVLLPVISLLRFKSVCKSWRALIQSSLFVHLHLNTNTLPPSNFGTFIFQTAGTMISHREWGNEAFMLSSGSGSGSGSEKEEDDNDELEEELKLEDLGFPPRYKVYPRNNDYLFMVGSCNGLICIHDANRRDVSLWNPATRQFRLLPKSLTLEGVGDHQKDFVAFGYDVKTKDYKVVQISHFRPYMTLISRWLSVQEYIFRVQVYSLTTDSWRLLEGISSFHALPYQVVGLNHGVYLNGSYYFLGLYLDEFATRVQRKDNVILSFDFTKEIFTTIQLPHDYHHPHTISTYLGEKLAVFAQLVDEEDRSDFETYEIWVLNEHGVKEESWTKLHVLYSDGTPRGISNNGEFALIGNGSDSEINGVYVYNGDTLELFNLVTKEVKKEFPTPHAVIKADVYKQSLVSIGGNGSPYDRVIGFAMVGVLLSQHPVAALHWLFQFGLLRKTPTMVLKPLLEKRKVLYSSEGNGAYLFKPVSEAQPVVHADEQTMISEWPLMQDFYSRQGVWDTKESRVAQVNFRNNLEISDAIIAAAGSMDSHFGTDLEFSPMLDTSPIASNNHADTQTPRW